MLKSPNDTHEYRLVTLPNSLKALLISRPETTSSAVALTVNIGSYYDTVPGLAHLTEHIIGRQKSFDGIAYKEFISHHGGFSNASTNDSRTMFHYRIKPDSLLQSIQVMADVFTPPLRLTEDDIIREISAVDAEHKRNLSNENRCLYELFNKVCSVEGSYKRRFRTGSIETLNIANIFMMVKEFYEKHYTPDTMNLVVLGIETLDVLEKVVINAFSKLSGIRTLTSPVSENLYHSGIGVNYKTRNNLIFSKLNWIIDPTSISQDDKIIERCLAMITHILGNEAPNTFIAIFKQDDTLKSMNVSSKYDRICSNYQLSIKVSVYRESDIDLLVGYLIGTLERLKNDIKESSEDIKIIYNQIKSRREERFLNFTIPHAHDYVTRLADYDFKNDMLIESLFDEWTDDIRICVLKIFDMMTIERCNIIWGEPNLVFTDPKVVPYYNIQYEITQNRLIVPMIDERVVQLRSNPFIIDGSIQQPIEAMKSSHLMRWKYQNPSIKNIYWTRDTMNKNTKVYIDIHYRIDVSDIMKFVGAMIYIKALKKRMNHVLYEASDAGYSVQIKYHYRSVEITMIGYRMMIKNIVELLRDYMEDPMTEFEIERAKFALSIKYQSRRYNSPTSILVKHITNCNMNGVYTSEDCMNTLSKIDISDIRLRFIELYRGTVIGDIDEGFVDSILPIFINLAPKYELYTYIDSVHRDIHYTTIDSENPREVNSAVRYTINFGYICRSSFSDYLKIDIAYDILSSLLKNHFFDTLRTKEKYGYIVTCSPTPIGEKDDNYGAFSFVVQSCTKSVSEIVARIQMYIIEAKRYINSIDIEQYTSLLSYYKTRWMDSINMIRKRTLYYRYISFNGGCDNISIQDIHNEIIEVIDNTQANDIIEFYRKYILENRKIWIACLRGLNEMEMEMETKADKNHIYKRHKIDLN